MTPLGSSTIAYFGEILFTTLAFPTPEWSVGHALLGSTGNWVECKVFVRCGVDRYFLGRLPMLSTVFPRVQVCERRAGKLRDECSAIHTAAGWVMLGRAEPDREVSLSSVANREPTSQ